MVWNLPNKLTASRIILIPFFVACAYIPGSLGMILSASFFALAAITDWADGYYARKYGFLTPFGRFFDPVADKLLVISALVLLVALDRTWLVLVLLMIAREITIMALRELMAGLSSEGLPVSRLGKWKTGFQLTAIIMLLVQDALFGIPFQWPGQVCMVVSVFLALLSGFNYMRAAWPRARESIMKLPIQGR